jgi:phosphoribosylformylglycinamidine (FGAM) synthase PurS component
LILRNNINELGKINVIIIVKRSFENCDGSVCQKDQTQLTPSKIKHVGTCKILGIENQEEWANDREGWRRLCGAVMGLNGL